MADRDVSRPKEGPVPLLTIDWVFWTACVVGMTIAIFGYMFLR